MHKLNVMVQKPSLKILGLESVSKFVVIGVLIKINLKSISEVEKKRKSKLSIERIFDKRSRFQQKKMTL